MVGEAYSLIIFDGSFHVFWLRQIYPLLRKSRVAIDIWWGDMDRFVNRLILIKIH